MGLDSSTHVESPGTGFTKFLQMLSNFRALSHAGKLITDIFIKSECRFVNLPQGLDVAGRRILVSKATSAEKADVDGEQREHEGFVGCCIHTVSSGTSESEASVTARPCCAVRMA